MSAAEVGDDVNGDDPTVLRLQERVAALLGMEAGLFVPSGTMSNAVAVRTHTNRGDEIIAEESSHLYLYEGATPPVRLFHCLAPEPLGFWNPRRLKSDSQISGEPKPLSQCQSGLPGEHFQPGRGNLLSP